MLELEPGQVVEAHHGGRWLRLIGRPEIGGPWYVEQLVVLPHRLGVVRRHRRRREEHVERHTVFLGRAPAPNLDPDVVAAPCDDDRELLVVPTRLRGQLVLNRAELIQSVLRLERQQLFQNSIHRLEREAARREVHLTGRRHHVRLFADVDHARLAVETHDRLEK